MGRPNYLKQKTDDIMFDTLCGINLNYTFSKPKPTKRKSSILAV